ncbi:hypothetical protein EV662_11716 [Rhodovulum marinum]|uniref:Uncharacterized protein n=1 Tax=Rhodovulum marinum TaxID=320662 RepID=A0A4R2PS85_9RHOB|nr:hypothetical protein EV662_11716 [Rhodovulum marinum]
MAQDVHTLLKSIGPSLTSDLIAEMVKAGASESAARKRVQREQESFDVQRLAGLRFEKNARFMYLVDQYGTSKFWQRFDDACRRAGKSYWSTIALLKARGGVIAQDFFPIVAGTPQARQRQLSPDRIFERLRAINVLETVEDDGRSYVRFHPLSYPRQSLAMVRAEEIAENIALQGIKDWARRIGFGSYGKFVVRGDNAPSIVSGIQWSMTAPSYMRPLVSFDGGAAKPGFFVCDINLHDVIGEEEALAFVRKCDLAAAPKKVAPIMPMLVAHVFSAEALSVLRSKGILAVTLQNLFGEELSDALRELVVMLTDLGARAAANPEHIRKVMNTLTKIEGGAENLRGALFELVVGSLVKDVEGGYLVTGERRTDLHTGRKAEIDVRLDRGEDKGVLVIECKAKKPGARVSESDVKRWYEDRVPLIYSMLTTGRDGDLGAYRFELWTNGYFTDSAKAWFKRQKPAFDGYSLGLRDGTGLKAYAQSARNPSLRDTLNEHYFRSPVMKVIA